MDVLNIILVILGFNFVIGIHEFGHFIAAKRAGITCPAFSIWFPLPPVVTKIGIPDRWRNIIAFTWRGTEYRLGWIPFGGFVTMKGQSDSPGEDGDNSGAKDDFRNVSYWQKVQVISGGVVMNAITGVIFFILAFCIFGVTFINPVAADVLPVDAVTGEPTRAWLENEITLGDRIRQVNGREVVDFEDVTYEAIFADGDVTMEFERKDGTRYTTQVPLARVHDKIALSMPPLRTSSQFLVTASEAKRSEGKLNAGELIHKINGMEIRRGEDVRDILRTSDPTRPLTLTVGDAGATRDVEHTARSLRDFANDPAFGLVVSERIVLQAVQMKSPAALAGLMAGDELTHYRPLDANGVGIGEPIALGGNAGLADAVRTNGKGGLEVTYRRGGGEGRDAEGMIATAILRPRKVGPSERSYSIGVLFKTRKASEGGDGLLLARVVEGSSAWEAGLRAGDRIMDVQGQGESSSKASSDDEEKSSVAMRVATRLAEAGTRMQLAMLSGGTPPAVTLDVRKADGSSVKVDLKAGGSSVPFLEVSSRVERSAPVTTGLWEAVKGGFYHTHKNVIRILQTLRALVSGDVAITNLAGPVMIAKASYDLLSYGFGTLLFFLGFISINLAVVNFLPIPVLDGGHFIIITLEKVLGRPMPEKAMAVVSYVFTYALIGLMLFVVFNDIRNLIVL